jgi:hypothetical protein
MPGHCWRVCKVSTTYIEQFIFTFLHKSIVFNSIEDTVNVCFVYVLLIFTIIPDPDPRFMTAADSGHPVETDHMWVPLL